MDLLNMTNRGPKWMNFIRRLNKGIFLFFKQDFSNYLANWRHEIYRHIQNFSSISL